MNTYYKWTSEHGKWTSGPVLLVSSRIRYTYDPSKIRIWLLRYWAKCKQRGWKFQYIQRFYIRFFESAISNDHWIAVVSFLKRNYFIYLWRNHNSQFKEFVWISIGRSSFYFPSFSSCIFFLSFSYTFLQEKTFSFRITTSSCDPIGDGTTKREGNRFLPWEINYLSCDPLTHFLIYINLVFSFFLFFPSDLSHSIFFPSFFYQPLFIPHNPL